MAEGSGSGSQPTVVVIGGGYGGLNAARALDDVADVTLVEQRDAFVHNVASLRALTEPGWLTGIFIPYDHLLGNGRVVWDRAVDVDVGRAGLASGAELSADFLVLATGSTYPFPAKTDRLRTQQSIDHYRQANRELSRAQRVLILGAGPVGIELAGEISSAWPEKSITIVDPEPEIVPGPFKPELREELHRQLAERDVELILGSSLVEEPRSEPGTLAPFSVRTSDGRDVEADIWFRCYGVRPVSDYLSGELASARRPDGFIEVTPELRVTGQTSVFALGDVSTADVKMAGRAGRQAETVAGNIRALIEGSPLQVYEPMPPVIVIPLGPDGGASQLPGQEEIGGAEITANIKGHAMLLDRYHELLGFEPATT